MNSPETNVIIRYGPAYNPNDVYEDNLIEVTGDKSGLHSGKIILAEGNRTILFEPDLPFLEGETITVKFLRSINTKDNIPVPMLSFNFTITERDINKNRITSEKSLLKEYFEPANTFNSASIKSDSHHRNYPAISDSLPEDFPPFEVSVTNNPSTGYIFMAPFNSWNFASTNYLTIVDNYGIPIFYRQHSTALFDFKKQDTGILSYFNTPTGRFYIMDSSYNVIDSQYTQNGYPTDLHELLILENNHSLMMSYDWQSVPMDTVVPGGNPDATVIGLIIQEQDENKNVVFQWRSWDHFKITDATFDISLTDSVIDYVHGNAIEVEDNGDILISSRNMDEVTKINRQTGEIIWRWGGEHCENNQFTFINDPIGFSHQHDIRKLDNGNYTIFDNGNLHPPPFSRFVEYQLDEVNNLAFLVWEHRNDPQSFSYAMGNASRLPNHNTLINWGTGTSPAVSEVKPSGDIAFFLSLPDTFFNYRGFKFLWKTNLFVSNPDSLMFGFVPVGDSLEMSLEIINNSDQQIEINAVYNRNSAYKVKTTLPITLAPFGTTSVSVLFKPEYDGDYIDDIHLQCNKEGQRIAQVVPITGTSDPTSVEHEIELSDFYLSQNYPNPFNPSTVISYRLPVAGNVSLKVYDMLGNEVATLIDEYKPAGSFEVEFNAKDLPSGIYFYQLKAGELVETKKMILLK
jgi:hypothetical protein